MLLSSWSNFIKYACRLCKVISDNRELVQEGGADCFPSWILEDYIKVHINQNPHDPWIKDCLHIQAPTFSMTKKSRAKLMKMPSKNKRYGNYTYWMKMAFESVSSTYLGKLFMSEALNQNNLMSKVKK